VQVSPPPCPHPPRLALGTCSASRCGARHGNSALRCQEGKCHRLPPSDDPTLCRRGGVIGAAEVEVSTDAAAERVADDAASPAAINGGITIVDAPTTSPSELHVLTALSLPFPSCRACRHVQGPPCRGCRGSWHDPPPPALGPQGLCWTCTA
jgi:hypothetical protein